MIKTEKVKVLINKDSNFKPLGEVSLNNSICFFTHRRPFEFDYESPISVRYINKGTVDYRVETSFKNVNSEKIFILPQPNKFSTIIPGDYHTQGISFFFDKDLINEMITLRVKGHNFVLDNPDSIEYLTPISLIPKQNDGISECLYKTFMNINVNRQFARGLDIEFEKMLFLLVDYKLKTFQDSENLLLCKLSSRKEIIRRLHLSRCYIHDNYQYNIKLKDMAEAAHLSKYCFQRYFKSFFNCSPTDYLMSLRMDKALELLINNDLPISSIASKCGFTSSQYFNYCFKQNFRVAPKNYRRYLN